MAVLWPADVVPTKQRAFAYAVFVFLSLCTLGVYIAIAVKAYQQASPTRVTYSKDSVKFPDIQFCVRVDPAQITGASLYIESPLASDTKTTSQLPIHTCQEVTASTLKFPAVISSSSAYPVSACAIPSGVSTSQYGPYSGPQDGHEDGALCFNISSWNAALPMGKSSSRFYGDTSFFGSTFWLKLFINLRVATDLPYSWGLARRPGQTELLGAFECLDYCSAKYLFSTTTYSFLNGSEVTFASFSGGPKTYIEGIEGLTTIISFRLIPEPTGEQIIQELRPYTIFGLVSQYFAVWSILMVVLPGFLFPLVETRRELLGFVATGLKLNTNEGDFTIERNDVEAKIDSGSLTTSMGNEIRTEKEHD